MRNKRSRLGLIALGLPVLALVLVFSLGQGPGQKARAAPAAGLNFSLSTTGCNSNAPPAKCSFPASSQFTAAFNLTSLGTAVTDYAFYDVLIVWSGNVNYILGSLKQTGAGTWVDGVNGCVFAVGEGGLSGGTPTPVGTKTVIPEGSLSTACTQGTGATAPSSYLGPLMTMGFNCKSSGQGTISLFHGDFSTDIGGGAVGGTHTEAASGSEALTVNCGTPAPPTNTPSGPTSTPTPTNTPIGPTSTPTPCPTGGCPTPTNTPTATNTPVRPTATPTRTVTPTPAKACGDVNDNGTVNPVDALLILQLGAGLITSLTNAASADVNYNGTINAIDATLILQAAAGLIPASGLHCS